MGARLDFELSLKTIPPPGQGCHPALLAVANRAARQGLPIEQAFDAIRAAIPAGKRKVSNREILDTLNKAYQEKNNNFTPSPKTLPVVNTLGQRILRETIERGRDATERTLRDASPVRLWRDQRKNAMEVLHNLYTPTDILFIGDRFHVGVRPQSVWMQDLLSGRHKGPFIAPNPMTGTWQASKSGNRSLRADACVASFRFAVVEFDNLPVADQIRWWWGCDLPVAALIHSGGKSVHGWVATPGIRNAEDWEARIERGLFRHFLQPQGVDAQCRNEARLSRIPGIFEDRCQQLLWLARSPRGALVRGKK